MLRFTEIDTNEEKDSGYIVFGPFVFLSLWLILVDVSYIVFGVFCSFEFAVM